MSHPTWVRGLKPKNGELHGMHTPVAPYVGAWIETYRRSARLSLMVVAPYVGAWIETD